ncbi:c2hc5 finger protein [Grosmannia clavigera kw1407]|uniref:C2hc5 finger protein n=1 Tax=Grosmannia clavigera (strain kw1407 / UAMH 11150) TaxID=655863 RepID=F0XJ12_GROCL|nr:c2hc5 finger protein [Grosmannia clavigera kw1407]EFX02410.1 c2hc5 finger protein [Grosmannia clavigera kw1407]
MSRTQLARLIDLPDDALQQVLDYSLTLSKADAVDHFKNLLGDSPAAVAFIADFNGRRHDPAGPSAAATAAKDVSPAATASRSSEINAVPKPRRGPKKKKAPLHTPPPRQVAQLAPHPGSAYSKKDVEDDYMVSRSGAVQAGASTTPPQQQQQQQRKPPSAAGSMIQDALQPKAKGSKAVTTSSRTNSKTQPAARITITGGTAMQGASTALADFDAAIRALEISTNPTLASGGSDGVQDVATRRCHCVATRHPLQTAAPNCLHCGKVICLKEGLGPCTFCGQPLLAADEVQAMIRELREQRGREKMAADKAAHRRPDVAGAAKPYARPTMIAGSVKWGGDDAEFVSLAEAQTQARAHRDRLLAFQAENAQRTTVRDEAADFDVGEAMALAAAGGSGAGAAAQNLWATPEERARALRRQQKLLREMEWNARPEYEKRRQVLSIDLAGRKVFKKTVAAERPPSSLSEDGTDSDGDDGLGLGGFDAGTGADASGDGAGAGGTFSKNPLLGRLIRPVYKPHKQKKEKAKGKGKGRADEEADDDDDESAAPLPGRKDDPEAASRWQRVQDDLNDNEAVILDGGIYGTGGTDEPGRG